jgi:hypothetical protein
VLQDCLRVAGLRGAAWVFGEWVSQGAGISKGGGAVRTRRARLRGRAGSGRPTCPRGEAGAPIRTALRTEAGQALGEGGE